MQTEPPHWLAQSYANPIHQSDVGILARNLRFARITRALIEGLQLGDYPALDYGGGCGIFVRLMRDAGYQFLWYDKHADNQFARGHESIPTVGTKFSLITAFEVLEHLVDPVQELAPLFQFTDCLLCSTLLLPPTPPRLESWWYYGLNHGQHVSLFTETAFRKLARRLGVYYCGYGNEIHLLSTGRTSPLWFKLLVRASPLLALRGRPSLLAEDYRESVRRIESGV